MQTGGGPIDRASLGLHSWGSHGCFSQNDQSRNSWAGGFAFRQRANRTIDPRGCQVYEATNPAAAQTSGDPATGGRRAASSLQSQPHIGAQDIATRLAQLDSLLQQGLIGPAAHSARKQQILAEL